MSTARQAPLHGEAAGTSESRQSADCGGFLDLQKELRPRREQILSGESPEPSLLAKKQPQRRATSLEQMVRRHKARVTEQRKEPRFFSAPDAASLTVNGEVTVPVDLSNSGLKVEGRPDLGLGAPVTVAFEGIEPINGQVIWTRGPQTGLSLQANALALDVD